MVLDLMHRFFSLPDSSGLGKNITILGADISSLVDIDNKKKDILIYGKGSTDGLEDTTLTAEKEYSINFTEQQKILLKLALQWKQVIDLVMVLKSINLK